jgi:hypothetical protein
VRQLLEHPAIQSSIVPLIAALVVGALFCRSRFSGLGIVGGFLATVYLVGNFALEPLTATRKLVVVGAAAGLFGSLFDLASRSASHIAYSALGLFLGACSIWVFWSVLVQKPAGQAILLGASTVAFLASLTALTRPLQNDPVRAGAAGVWLGLGVGTAAVFGASALLGQYGLALGAGCGGFLLLAVLRRGRLAAGATVTLTIAVIGGLTALAAVLLAELAWWSVIFLMLIPLAVRLPLPAGNVWARAALACAYGFVVASGACGLAYWATRA